VAELERLRGEETFAYQQHSSDTQECLHQQQALVAELQAELELSKQQLAALSAAAAAAAVEKQEQEKQQKLQQDTLQSTPASPSIHNAGTDPSSSAQREEVLLQQLQQQLDATVAEKDAREKQLLGELRRKGDTAREMLLAKDEELRALKNKLKAAIDVATTTTAGSGSSGSGVGSVAEQSLPVVASARATTSSSSGGSYHQILEFSSEDDNINNNENNIDSSSSSSSNNHVNISKDRDNSSSSGGSGDRQSLDLLASIFTPEEIQSLEAAVQLVNHQQQQQQQQHDYYSHKHYLLHLLHSLAG